MVEDIYHLIVMKHADRVEITTRQPRTSLLYKATRHGFFASSFHSKCDG